MLHTSDMYTAMIFDVDYRENEPCPTVFSSFLLQFIFSLAPHSYTLQLMFLPQSERPCFTLIQNNGKNCSFVYFNLYVVKVFR